jgi:hypothetical protein
LHADIIIYIKYDILFPNKERKIENNILFIIIDKKYRMGNKSSKQAKEENLIKQQKLQEEALRNFTPLHI